MILGRRVVALACSAATALPVAAADRRLATFDNAPARPLTAGDLQVTVEAPARLDDVEGRMARVRLDLRRSRDLAELRSRVESMRALARSQDAYQDAHPERVLPFAHDLGAAGKRRALDEMAEVLDGLIGRSNDPAAGRERAQLRLLELLHAVENSFRYPIKRDYQLVPDVLPIALLRVWKHPSVSGPGEPAGADAAAGDPAPSSFWSPPGDIAAKRLYAGFGRRAMPRLDDVTCEYVGPKTGWGAHPGFHARCGEADVRFKMGDEVYGGPFNSRLFDALGYHTYPIDPMKALRLRYDRRVFTQYNSRKYLSMRARLLFVTLFTHVVTRVEDPFARIDHAVLDDGRKLTGAQLKASLLKDARVVKGRPRPEAVDANYDADFERHLTTLVWTPGTVAYEPDSVKQVGAWDYDQLDHAARREVRGVLVLAAWVDQFNMRWENTRLSYVQHDGGWRLEHFFSDVGSGLGFARSAIATRNSDIEDMPWEVTERTKSGVKFSGFALNVNNDAFASATLADAQWMLRKIGALSERQLLEALVATGLSAAEVRLALEKLLSKRRKMVEDFGLAGALPEVMARRIDRTLDFDPRREADRATLRVARADGTSALPDVGAFVVSKGHLVRVTGPAGPAVSGAPESGSARGAWKASSP